jgi:hypothetical protein
MKCECKEIFKLKVLLDKNKIPYEFYNQCYEMKHNKDFPYFESWQILVPNAEKEVISIIEGLGSYGYTSDKLEIKGLLTEYEKEFDIVVGCLSAEEVLNRIKKYSKIINGKW